MEREKAKGKETSTSSKLERFKVHKGLYSKSTPIRSGKRNPFDDDPASDHGDDEPEGGDDRPDGDGDHDDDDEDEDPEDPDDLRLLNPFPVRVQQPEKYNP